MAEQQKPKFGAVDASAKAVQLGFGSYRFVKIQARFTNDDGTPNTATVRFGDSLEQAFEILTGQFSEWIPINDLSEVWVRAVPTPGVAGSDKCTVAYQASDRAS